MNAPVTAKATELQEVERSLDFLITAIIDLDTGPKRHLPPQLGPMSIAELAKEYRWDAPTTEAERFALKVRYDPVREALCFAVRRLGQRLHELGGLSAMRGACDRQEDFPHGMHRVSIIDKRFDGIGDWIA